MKFSRRGFVSATLATGVAAAGVDSRVEGARTKVAGLASLTTAAMSITAQEHEARIAKLQALMQRAKVAALLVDAGSTLEYFTGVRWSRSERTTAALIPAAGRTVLVTPFFEAPSIAETLKINADVRAWKEDESPFDLLAGALREQAAARRARGGRYNALLHHRSCAQGGS